MSSLRAYAAVLALLHVSCTPQPSGPSSGRAVSALADGSWFVAGRFEQRLDLPGQDDALASQGARDAFLARYDADAEVTWARSVGGAGGDDAWDVVALRDGSALLTGEIEGRAAFSSAAGPLVMDSAGETDAFLARYDAGGSLLWVRAAGGAGQDFGRAIDAFPDGSGLVAGRFEGEICFERGTLAEQRIAARGERDAFVARYSSQGNLAWAVALGGTGSDYAQDVVALPDGSCLIAGSFEGTLVVGDPAAGGLRLTAAGKEDVFVCRLDAGGAPLWARSGGGTEDDSAHAVAALADGACVVTGRFGGTAVFGGSGAPEVRLTALGARDVFVARFDAAGALVWARAAGGPGSDYGRALAALADGTCLVTGYFDEEAFFGRDERGETRLESDGGLDLFVARLDRDGRLLEATRFGRWGSERSNGIATLGDRAFVLVGERPLPDSTEDGELLVLRSELRSNGLTIAGDLR